MANITVTVPDEFKERMEEHLEINWDDVAEIAEKIDEEMAENLLGDGN